MFSTSVTRKGVETDDGDDDRRISRDFPDMTLVGEEDAAPSGGYELVSTAPRNEGPWRRNLERLDSLDVDDDEELEDPR